MAAFLWPARRHVAARVKAWANGTMGGAGHSSGTMGGAGHSSGTMGGAGHSSGKMGGAGHSSARNPLFKVVYPLQWNNNKQQKWRKGTGCRTRPNMWNNRGRVPSTRKQPCPSAKCALQHGGQTSCSFLPLHS